MADQQENKENGRYLLAGAVFAALVVLTVMVLYLNNRVSVMPKVDPDDEEKMKGFASDAVGQQYELTQPYVDIALKQNLPAGTKFKKEKLVDQNGLDFTNEMYLEPYVTLRPEGGNVMMIPINSLKKVS